MHRSRADDSTVTQVCVGFPTAVRTASGSKGLDLSVSAPVGAPPAEIAKHKQLLFSSSPGTLQGKPMDQAKRGSRGPTDDTVFLEATSAGEKPLCRTAVKRSRARPDVTRLSRHGCPQEAAPSRRVRPLFYRIDPTVPIRYNQRRYHPLDGLLIFRLHLANPLSPQPLKQTR